MIASVDNSGRGMKPCVTALQSRGWAVFEQGTGGTMSRPNGIRRAGFATQLGEDGVAFLAACLLAGPIAVMPREMSTQSRL